MVIAEQRELIEYHEKEKEELRQGIEERERRWKEREEQLEQMLRSKEKKRSREEFEQQPKCCEGG